MAGRSLPVGTLVIVSLCGALARAATPSAAAMQLELAAHPAIKLAVRATGWVRVTQPELVAAGLPPDIDPAALQLFADGLEHALQVTGNGDDRLDPGEALEFYGTGRDDQWTDTRTYWLVVGSAGARVPYVANPRGEAPPTSFAATATLRERKLYYAPLLNGDDTNFLGATVDATGVTQSLALPHVAAGETGTLSVALQGVTSGEHAVAVTLGGLTLGTCAYSGQAAHTCSFALSAVTEGANVVTLKAMGTPPDLSLVASVSIGYDHALLADGTTLAFTVPPKTRVTLGGFPTVDVRVVDVTDAAHPVELVTAPGIDGGSFTASFDVQDADGRRALYAFTEAAVGKPAAVAASHVSDWMAPREGQLLILSHAQFLEALRPLAARRASEGWSVALVDLQDVYDELSGGDKTPFAIRDFVRTAGARWSAPPQDVLLVGDATFDPRNFTGLGDFDFAPTKLVDTMSMETSSDGWFVDGDGDGVPDLAIGRFPVRTSAQAAAVVAKTLAYSGKDDLSRGGLFVADTNDGDLDFEQASADSEGAVSDLMPIDRFAAGATGATPAGLIAKLDQGPFLVNYFGHGSVEVWEDLFSSSDAKALTNTHASIYVGMNCLNGFFHDLYTTSLAESLLEAPSGGAVAVWASSTLVSFEPQRALNRTFLSRLARGSLGQADLAAKRAVTDLDTRRTWMIFGDPTLLGAPLPPVPDAGAPAGDAASDGGGGAAADARAAPDALPPDAAVVSGLDAADASGAGDGAGPDEAGRRDAGGADRGAEPASAGCGCRVPAGSSDRGLAIVALALALLTARRRRRR